MAGNDRPARKPKSPWDRFSEAVLQRSDCPDAADPLDLPIPHIYFRIVLDASISLGIAQRHFEAVMARNTSTDLDICASNDAQYAAQRHLDKCWEQYTERYADERREAAIASMQAPA